MSLDAIADLIDRYFNDASFRTAFADDPEAAIEAAGYTLDESEHAALHNALASTDDQTLKPRVTRYSFGS